MRQTSWRRFTHYAPDGDGAAGGGGGGGAAGDSGDATKTGDGGAAAAGGAGAGQGAAATQQGADVAGAATLAGASGAAAGTAGAADAGKSAVVPEKYELKLPENAGLPAEALERTAAVARELGLPNAAAQRTLEFVNAEVVAQRTALLEAHRPGGAEWAKQEQQWRADALADPALGNGSPATLEQRVDLGKRALSKFFPPETLDFLNSTGFGSHPSVLKGLVKIGAAMAEDGVILPGTAGAGAGKRSPEDILYGATTKP